MAIEHEPGCDRQHTARQRCNQNVFAEQGEVVSEMHGGEHPAPATTSALRDQPTPAPEEMEQVEEIVAIREDVLIPEPMPAPLAPDQWRSEEVEAPGGYGLLIGLGVAFAVVTIVLVMLLRGRGEGD